MIGREGWQVTLPGGPLTLLQIAIGIVDLACCAAAMYMLVPDEPNLGFVTVAVIFVAATLLGFASHAPGRLGVFDAAMLVALWQFDKEDLLVLKIGNDRGQVALDLQQGSGGGLEVNSQLISDDIGQSGLTQAGGTIEQNVVHGFAARASSFDSHREIFLHLFLANEFGQTLRPQLQLERGVVPHGSR